MASDLERSFLTQWRWYQDKNVLPGPVAEYRFAAEHVGTGRGIRERLSSAGLRDWRADFAWPEHKLLVELEGGTYSRGRHVRGAGFANDCRKYNAATRLGWRVLRYTSDMVRDDFVEIMYDIVQILTESKDA